MELEKRGGCLTPVTTIDHYVKAVCRRKKTTHLWLGLFYQSSEQCDKVQNIGPLILKKNNFIDLSLNI